jgi:uncharacterized protein YciW
VNRLHTLSAYDRLSTALTVAQACGVQRLCNHYAARLAPLPGPDSSRESNRRLAQITQYARQLASSPDVIDDKARNQLDEVGLSTYDIVVINQIIGFIGFQARVVAIFRRCWDTLFAGCRGTIFSRTRCPRATMRGCRFSRRRAALRECASA